MPSLPDLRLKLLIPMLFVLLQVSRAQFINIDAQSAAQVEYIFLRHLQKFDCAGGSLGLIRNGEIVYLHGFGFQNAETGIPATEFTMYRTASIAKTITAVLALQLKENGKLDLFRNVRDYVPEYPQKAQGVINAHHLLSHQSGIPHNEDYDTLQLLGYEEKFSEFNAVAAVDVFKNSALRFAPGSDYLYTTFGYNLLGAVVERAGAQQYLAQLRERILTKGDLPFLQAEYASRRPYPNETKGYHRLHGNRFVTTDTIGIKYKVPGGGMIGTVIDLTLFLQQFLSHGFFTSQATEDSMTMIHAASGSYGYGLWIGERNGKKILWHSGSQEKTNTMMLLEPKSKNAVAVMLNTFQSEAKLLAEELLDAIPTMQSPGKKYQHIPHLLDRPTLLSPQPGEKISDARATLQWSGVPFGYSYVVQIDTTPSFLHAVSDSHYSTEIQSMYLGSGKKYFWRVKAVNAYLYDGTESDWSETRSFSVLPTTRVERPAQRGSMRLFPNPNAGTFDVATTSIGQRIEAIEIYTIIGQKIFEEKNLDHQSYRINLSSRAPSMLFVKITASDGSSYYQKISIIGR